MDFSSLSYMANPDPSSSAFPTFAEEDFDLEILFSQPATSGSQGELCDSVGPSGSANHDTTFDSLFDFGRMDAFAVDTNQADYSLLGRLDIDSRIGAPELGIDLVPSTEVDHSASIFTEGHIFDFGPFDPTCSSDNRDSFDTQLVNGSSNVQLTDEHATFQNAGGENTNNHYSNATSSESNSTQPLIFDFPQCESPLQRHSPTPPANGSQAPSEAATTQGPEAASLDEPTPASTSQQPRKSREKEKSGSNSEPSFRRGFPGYPVVDANGVPFPEVLRAMDSSAPVEDPSSSASAGSVRTRHARLRHTRSHHTATMLAKKANEKAVKERSRPERNPWRVTVAPAPAHVPSELQTASASGSGEAQPSSTNGTGTKIPRRRKKTFYHVDISPLGSKERPLVIEDDPEPAYKKRTPPPKRRKKKNEITSDNHSEMGWVFARLREPESSQFGWAIAAIHEPRASSYHVLSGPHIGQVRTVRDNDRIKYSQETMEELKKNYQEACERAGTSRVKAEKVYDAIPEDVDIHALVRGSSVHSVGLATRGVFTFNGS
ncbi:uncharacterized protein FOMMEDRAFT_143361 [Fomitiporia mediterranea MF3/22]|uniref:uncharacterized protein n=1 Tax=Fomitiporia mediterranea (strain MF3/22) TaxID=694068 RepID=UPI00044092A2|nr:uncharacterized protein FOMMEDRAFT_143361 [Fomitiporia mediterranea MF3/22]EJC98325.1 hypothetical protein FOMMEDRAFT_143361 [Fomitiporia mediterranea MF3/22]